MAQQTIVELVDDLHGGPADETVQFALDGKDLVIDLDAENASGLRDALAEYIDHARLVRGRRPRNRRKATAQPAATAPSKPAAPRFSTTLDADAATVRAWAKRRGIPINARGRISDAVMDEFRRSTKPQRRR